MTIPETMKSFIAAALLTLAFSAAGFNCRRPPNTLTPEDQRLAGTYVELLILHEQFAASDTSGRSAEIERQRLDILQRAELTRSQFDSQFVAISLSPERAHPFFDAVERLVAERKHLQR